MTSLYKDFIYTLIFKCRQTIANHLKNIYSLDRLALRDANNIICVDEFLFTHNAEEQQWVVGIINTTSNDIRLKKVENSNETTLKTIIEKHVATDNIIYSDFWSGYNFLSRVNSGYQYNFVNHNNGIFNPTSKIEEVLGEIKSLIKNMPSSIHSKHFVYFIKEVEYKRKTKKSNRKNK